MQELTDIRFRFGWLEDSPIGWADDQLIRASQVSLRSMNFGQHWRTPTILEVGYCLHIPLAFIADVFARELPDYIEDAIRFPGDDTFEAALRNRHWPAAKTILADAELCPLALQYFGHEILLAWLGDGEPCEAPGYIINTIERCSRFDQFVEFRGRARKAGQKVAYQDT
jgi:hypothetical protein